MSASATKKAVLYIFNTDLSYSTEDRLKEAVFSFLCASSSETMPHSLCDDTMLQICRTSLGKPYLPHLSGIFVSASHSGEYLLCAVSDTKIGVDIQRHERIKNETEDETNARLQKLSKRFFHPKEAEFITKQPWDRFFKVWTAKESYVKYTGEGITDNFMNFSILPNDCRILSEENDAKEFVRWSASDVCFHQIDFDQQYTVCVCTKELVNIHICRL
jgi:phosphopantetheine--protein transferase-like protein